MSLCVFSCSSCAEDQLHLGREREALFLDSQEWMEMEGSVSSYLVTLILICQAMKMLSRLTYLYLLNFEFWKLAFLFGSSFSISIEELDLVTIAGWDFTCIICRNHRRSILWLLHGLLLWLDLLIDSENRDQYMFSTHPTSILSLLIQRVFLALSDWFWYWLWPTWVLSASECRCLALVYSEFTLAMRTMRFFDVKQQNALCIDTWNSLSVILVLYVCPWS